MKKTKFLSLICVLAFIVGGCSCKKIDEETYENAVSIYKSSDALSFSRLEIISKKGETTYSRKKIDAKYIFDSKRNVTLMQYSRVEGEGSNTGGNSIKDTIKYYYSLDEGYFYVHSIIGESNLDRYKEEAVSYNSKFNVNVCDDTDKDCLLLISNNLAPVFNLNEVSDFNVNDDSTITFKAVCPNYEHCSSNSEIIDYTITLNDDGNIYICPSACEFEEFNIVSIRLSK